MRRSLACLIGLAGSLALAPAALSQSPAPLEGETVIATFPSALDTLEFETTCEDGDGKARARMRGSGLAVGPYPGTFEETVEVTLGPAGAGGDRVIESLEVSFRIVSGDTVITGEKSLDPSLPPRVGSCTVVELPEASRPGETCRQTDFRFNSLVRYRATITTGEGSTTDSGQAAINGFTSETRGCTGIGDNDQAQLFEVFLTSDRLGVSRSKATGGGRTAGTSSVTFGFTARTDADGRTDGRCSLVDHAAGVQVRCLDVQAYVQVGNQVTFSGRALVGGLETTYRIHVTDAGEGLETGDSFTIQTESGYTAGGVLESGNIQVHGR